MDGKEKQELPRKHELPVGFALRENQQGEIRWEPINLVGID